MNLDLIIEDLYHSCNGLQFTIEILNIKARNNLINAKCRWHSNRLDGTGSCWELLGRTKVMEIRQRETTHEIFCLADQNHGQIISFRYLKYEDLKNILAKCPKKLQPQKPPEKSTSTHKSLKKLPTNRPKTPKKSTKKGPYSHKSHQYF